MKNKEYGETKITYEQLRKLNQWFDTLIDAVEEVVKIASDELNESNPENEYDEYIAGRYIMLDGALECLRQGRYYIEGEMKCYE